MLLLNKNYDITKIDRTLCSSVVVLNIEKIYYYYARFINGIDNTEKLSKNLLNYYIDNSKGIFFLPSSFIENLYMSYQGSLSIIRKSDIDAVSKETILSSIYYENIRSSIFDYYKKRIINNIYEYTDIYAADDEIIQILDVCGASYKRIVLPESIAYRKNYEDSKAFNMLSTDEESPRINGIFFNEEVYGFPRYKKDYDSLEEVYEELKNN